MRGGLHWGKPSSDIHTSPTCCESATQSLSAPGTTVSRAWSRGRGGGGVGARVWSQRAPRHTWGRRGEVIKALAFPQGISESHTCSRLPSLALLGS